MLNPSIGIITTHNANNYGAALQCYAVKTILSEFGSTHIIDYQNNHVSQSLNIIRFSLSIRGLMAAGKDLLRLRSRWKVIKRFHAFAENHFDLTISGNRQELCRNLPKFNLLVSGSDQIWNPNCVSGKNEIDPAYYLELGNPEAIFVAFSSSWGDFKFDNVTKPVMVNLLKKYHKISVRESDSKKILSEWTDQKIEHICDPTLLLDSKVWLHLVDTSVVEVETYTNAPYLLCYSVSQHNLLKTVVAKVAELSGLQVILLDQDNFFSIPNSKKITNAGPLEFIRLIANAEFVVTDSLHGLCFSLIFGKSFFSVGQGLGSNRIQSVLRDVGLLDRLILDVDTITISRLVVDYENTNKKIAELRQQAKLFVAEIFAL